VFSNPEWGASRGLQPVLHVNVLRSDCQQIIAHPSERNASWMSARRPYFFTLLHEEDQVSEVLLHALNVRTRSI
jgi:hypothetical protein